LAQDVHFGFANHAHVLTTLKGQTMTHLLRRLANDETGFIVSSELVLIATLLVIGVIVGLSEVQHAIVSELNDVADSVGSVNQSYKFSGFSSYKTEGRGIKAVFAGSSFRDSIDECDNNECDLDCLPPRPEGPKGGGHH
jgi:Flp pilus assembly pilin Flp